MNWTTLFCGTLLIVAVYADNKSSNKNEISAKKTESKTEPTIRKALLKAMETLEKQAQNEDSDEAETVTSHEELLEESTNSEQGPIIRFLPTIETKTESEPKEEQIEFLLLKSDKKTRGTDKDESNVISYTVQVPRSISSKTENDLFKNDNKVDKDTLKKVVPTPTTTTTTTTTTKAPTHNADGENIEVVDQKDIHIQSAPLVTAFTVQQDLLGEPKKVIPLLNPSPIPPTPTTQGVLFPGAQQGFPNLLPSELRQLALAQQNAQIQRSNQIFPSHDLLQQQQQRSNAFIAAGNHQQTNQFVAQQNFHQQPQQHFNHFVQQPQQQTSSLTIEKSEGRTLPLVAAQTQNFNNVLLERQRLLEEQIRLLQAQARQQQEQILIQQQLLQEQQRKRIIEQSSKNAFQNLVQPVETLQKVQSQPKFEFNNEQQLPIKEAVNFRTNSVGFNNPLPSRTTVQIQPSNQLNFITPQQQQQQQQTFNQGFLPLELSKFQQLPQKTFQTFSTVPQLGTTIIPSISTAEHKQQGPHQRTRVFRQESGTGNFGFNNFNSNQNFFRPSQAFQPVDNQIQNLLYQSGISPKSNEDFSIISKVLALNHGISPFTPQNFHFHGQFGSF